jgi:hypothetical protein
MGRIAIAVSWGVAALLTGVVGCSSSSGGAGAADGAAADGAALDAAAAASEAQSDAPPAASATTCTDANVQLIQASNYDQSCKADSDCIAVGEGNACDSCAIDCTNAAINKSAETQYKEDVAKMPAGVAQTGPVCSCPVEFDPCCRGGTCHADLQCQAPLPVTDAAADTGMTDGGDDACFPTNDGMNSGTYTFDLTVDDTGFSKMLLSSQNSAQVTLTLTNNGTKPHGFTVGCTSVTPAYPTLPAGCPTTACFPSNSTIAPIAPGASTTITFETPVPDNLIYPFTSNEPYDSAVAALNSGQWSLM